jgi:transcriptional regulator with XRE-family HTH domain
MDTVGERIRQAREQAVLSQGELAEAAGINRASVSLIETGRAKPRPSTLRRIAQALGVPASELATGAK